ncbi:tetratricopeptide repeat protein [Geothrix sp. 21YS21S-2]|uniref:tetratricopeptide repeat protein n=1 Tax=Geothrix sp. 21YS21S-2 TaxID=3068893 RepID=UPI0027B8E199|nr:tetratricopeptide repeat protein [Geothrix sp. 21YS21S-2]
MILRAVPFSILTLALAAGGYSPRPDLDAGHYLKALAAADAELKADPANALALAARSQALTAMMRLPEALAAGRRAAELNPRLGEALLARALARAGTAIQQKNLGSLRGVSAAMDDLRGAVKAEPGLVAAWMALGLGYEQLPGILGGSTRRALECAEVVRKLDPGKGSALKGTILSMEGEWPQAEAAFGTALAISPKDPEVTMAYLDALGSRETRKDLGEEEQKRRLAREARRLLPGARGSARALCSVCDALIDAGMGEEAWNAALAALPAVDAPSLIQLELGKISARTGVHADQGLAFLDQVLKAPLEGGSGGYGTAHWRRGQILKNLGRKNEAQAAARAALALDPKDAKASRLLEELR